MCHLKSDYPEILYILAGKEKPQAKSHFHQEISLWGRFIKNVFNKTNVQHLREWARV